MVFFFLLFPAVYEKVVVSYKLDADFHRSARLSQQLKSSSEVCVKAISIKLSAICLDSPSSSFNGNAICEEVDTKLKLF